MPRENPYLREIIASLRELFGKDNLNAKEYAKYLAKDPAAVTAAIRKGQLPGKAIGSDKKPDYVISIHSIALHEINSAPKGG